MQCVPLPKEPCYIKWLSYLSLFFHLSTDNHWASHFTLYSFPKGDFYFFYFPNCYFISNWDSLAALLYCSIGILVFIVLRVVVDYHCCVSIQVMMRKSRRMLLFSLLILSTFQQALSDSHQPLSKVGIHNTIFALHERAYIKATPNLLGLKVSFDSLHFHLNCLGHCLDNHLSYKCSCITYEYVISTSSPGHSHKSLC